MPIPVGGPGRRVAYAALVASGGAVWRPDILWDGQGQRAGRASTMHEMNRWKRKSRGRDGRERPKDDLRPKAAF
jgi:hypothetical protein